MSTQGTLDHPSTRDPQPRHLSELDPTMKNTSTDHISRRAGHTAHRTTKRNRQMHLMPESMARAHMESRLYEAESEQWALRVRQARRLQRRAERASLRARKAVARLVM
ncbi:hypothetical protein [Streptomyces sp. TR06-5]|uniref:hypothetical protein n=1 Tax=unclassified Streptomyces TaxID=2593676 RepID=UPI00399F7B60